MNEAAKSNDCSPSTRRPNHDSAGRLTVFYDGDCPICRIEVGFYQQIDRTDEINWHDLTKVPDEDLPAGKTRRKLLGVFHARCPDNEWKTGIDAFGVIWSRLPVFRCFAWIFSVPILRQIAEVLYRLFLTWQRNNRARRQRLHTNNHGRQTSSH